MDKEEILNKIAKERNKNILLEMATGYGKSKMALDIIKQRGIDGYILIVVPKLVLINNWQEELSKWGFDAHLLRIKFTTYSSLGKHWNQVWQYVIWDEAHHITQRIASILLDKSHPFRVGCNILLSATVPYDRWMMYTYLFKDIRRYSVTTRDAVEQGVLPDPRIKEIPLELDNTKYDFTYIIHKTKKTIQTVKYEDIKGRFLRKDTKYIVPHLTELQYYRLLDWEVKLAKENYIRSSAIWAKNLWLQKANMRLRWLGERKTEYVKEILRKLKFEKDHRVIVFCSSIEQAKAVCSAYITSDNADSQGIINAFNKGEISQISACQMLNEGVNLKDCKYGLWAGMNTSDVMIIQKIGRCLRHPEPVLILPYFVGTRDEEAVKKMLTLINKDE